jgi:hypothetical protein
MKEKIVDKDLNWVNSWNEIPVRTIELAEDKLTDMLKKLREEEDFILKVIVKHNNPGV